MYRSNLNSFKGFTLVELIVAVSVFITTVTIAVGALFSAQSINTRLQSTHTVLDGMNLSFELISRNVRYGTIFYCGNDITLSSERSLRKSCPFSISNLNAGGNVIVFRPVDAGSPEDRIGYYLNNGKVFEWHYVNGIEESPRQITSDEVIIDTLRFFITGANSTQQALNAGNSENKDNVTDIHQPIITVIITGKTIPKKKAESVQFQMQTSITPRGIDS